MNSQKQKILIVEDEKDISEILEVQLCNAGYDVKLIPDGTQALEFIQKPDTAHQIDLFLLDRMLPGTSGLEICKFLRMFKATKSHPILMLTAMTRPEDIVEGLDAGADDYITKPFDTDILLARVRSLLRRSEQIEITQRTAKSTFTIGSLKVDTDQCKVWINQNEIDLTLSEYKLLVTFLGQPGKVFTRNQLVEFIQDGPVHVTDRTIDTHIFGLRKKLLDQSRLIETIRGVGYRVAPV